MNHIHISRQAILAVYRYHLAYTGDPEGASESTLAAFRLAARRSNFEAYPPDPADLLAAARYQRAFHRPPQQNDRFGSDSMELVSLEAHLALMRASAALPGPACRLEFVVQITPRSDARLLPGTLKLVTGDQASSNTSGSGDLTRLTITVDLSAIPTAPLLFQFTDATLILQGGWQIRWDRP